jgi:putative ABC transport system permease protein
VHQALAGLDPTIAPGELTTIEDRLAKTRAFPRFRALLLVSFAGFALILVMLGGHGLVTQFVAQRTRETGIRLALGATPVDIARLVITHAGLPVVLGLLIGLGSSQAVSIYLEHFLYGVRATDPLTLTMVAVAVGTSMAGALWSPVRRATRVDSIAALRAE